MEYLIYSIEDDVDIANIINKTLSKQGYLIKSFGNAKTFLEVFNENKPNMILLDMMLPDMHGLELLKIIRGDRKNDDIEIIIISADHLLMTKVEGLDLGADDYIEKPFDLLELMSRVNAKVRRYNKNQVLCVQNLSVDINKRECFLGEEEIILTEKEFDILFLLLKSKGNVVSREDMTSIIWSIDACLETRTIDMHIKSLRSKLKDKGSLIKTVYGIGYKVSV